jgi:hypothetical protein
MSIKYRDFTEIKNGCQLVYGMYDLTYQEMKVGILVKAKF